MATFLTPVDIANRALQHLGALKIDAAQGFAENSKNADETSFVYPKARVAELQRNYWTFATFETVLRAIGDSTMLLQPTLWVSTTTYFVGSIVSDETGYLWECLTPDNLNLQPEDSTTWRPYFGPLSVSLYDSTQAYFSGELVYTTAGDGTYRVYRSLQSANSDNPATATAWSSTVTYIKDQIVTRSAVAYLSMIDLNLNQDPVTTSHAPWSAATTYAIGNSVYGSDGVVYTSLANGNINHDPISSPAFWTNTGVLNPWTTTFTGGTGSLKWLQIGGAEFPMGVGLTAMRVIYPVGTGPDSQLATRSIYRLPANYLRTAPQDPKAGSATNLGSPTSLLYTDWLYEGDFIKSRDVGPIVLRFVADIVDVTRMDPMFCEGLAARIALETCEPITQSTSKLQIIAKEYEKFMTEARTVNAIEAGAIEPPMDDYLACRL